MKEKKTYVVPECEMLLVQLEGTIALSQNMSVNYNGFNREEEEW